MIFGRYIVIFLASCSVILLLVAGFNWLIDPYAILSAPRLEGLNDAKPFAGSRGRTTKRYQVQDVRPAGLIAGNSRAEMGLDPNHRCWPLSARPVYNTAIPGLSVYDQVRFVQHGQAAGEVKAVVMSVDFLDFLHFQAAEAAPNRWPPYAEENSGFLVDANGHPTEGTTWARFQDYSSALLSLDTFADSVLTVIQQSDPFVLTRSAQGFNHGERIYEPIIRYEGVGVLFAQKNREVMGRLKSNEWSLYEGNSKWSSSLEALQRFLQQNNTKGIETVLFISPYHAEYLAILDIAGLWPLFEAWKRHLAEITRARGVPLWDFSGFDSFSEEAIEGLSDTGEALTWFWEPAHYRKSLGDIVLANIWRAHCPTDEHVDPYGARIDQIDLEPYFAARRAEKERYMERHSQVVRRLSRLLGGSSGSK